MFNTRKLLIIFINIIVFVSFIYIKNNNIKELAYKQNNYNLDNIINCINTLNPNDKKEFRKDIIACAGKSLSLGETGDVFVAQESDMKIFWDASSDCSIKDNATLTKDSICGLFAEPRTCLKAAEDFKNNNSGNITWKFDDSIEYVSFRKYPFKDETYIIGQGAQDDEINSIFWTTNLITYLVDIIILIIIFNFI